MVHEVAGLERVGERHPRQVAEAEHEAEALGGYVHGRQNGRLKPQTIQDIEPLQRAVTGFSSWSSSAAVSADAEHTMGAAAA